ncbi:MAG: arginine--tRNA ligase [Deltaproteobacteria bacterium]
MKGVVADILERTLARAQEAGTLPPWSGQPTLRSTLDAPKNPAHGDWASNVAMLYAKAAGRPPREIAMAIKDGLVDPGGVVAALDVAGPGFLNFRLAPAFWWRELGRVSLGGADFGRSDIGAGQKVNVEFVSANPTGPMHVGHGRGAVTGDAIASLLSAAGHAVTREYYINDAGGQIRTLARSVHVRYRQLFGEAVELPEESYPGEYVIAIAAELKEKHGDRFLRAEEAEWQGPFASLAIERVLAMIRGDLAALDIRFDVWTSEKARLHDTGALRRVLDGFRARGLLYDQDGAVFFRSTLHGDDKDRPVVKSNGDFTYLAADIAYHADKFARGFDWCLNVWGADHHGDIPRVRAAVKELGVEPERLRFALVQMVNLLRDGQPFKMSKRAGTVVSLRDVVDEVGADATRFYFLLRRSDAQLDFDVALAKKQSNDNPVFYVQYGHARLCSILRRAREQGIAPPTHELAALASLTLPEELDLAKRILGLPELVAGAALAFEPHRVVFFLQETVAAFHAYYTRYKTTEKVIGPDPVKTAARLYLCDCLRQAMANALAMLGVSAPERMERSEDAGDEG